MKTKALIGFFLCWSLGLGYLSAQRFLLPEQTKSERIPFEFLNNLILIPVEVNGTELTFVLDSGVGKPLLFNMMGKDSIEVRNVSEVQIKGLGDGEAITALKSLGNGFRIGEAWNFNQELFVVMDEALNFSPALGVPVHGIIGYDLFRDFVVEINYSNKYLKLHNPKFYKPKRKKKDVSLALDIKKTKAYLNAEVLLEKGKNIPVKLLIDTGSSDALWLFNQPEKGLEVPDKNYEDFLGRGLSGDVFGKRTKINGVKIAKFEMFDAKVAFPHRESLTFLKNYGSRNGSVGGELLKRFNVVFDYGNHTMTLRKNLNYNTPFEYNLSGINLQHDGIRYISERIANTVVVPRTNYRGMNSIGSAQMVPQNATKLTVVPEIVISAIRAGSPAEEVGLRKGDVVLEVNGKQVHQYKLQEIIKMINAKKGKRVKLLIERYNRDLLFSFVLKELF